MLTFRDHIRLISPRWLRRGLAEKILYALAVHLDLIGDAAVAAVRRRFPIADESDDALELQGRDRKLPRGIAEPAASYAVRLQHWLDDKVHRTRGGPYAMLEQLAAYYAHDPEAPTQIELVYASGTTISLESRGAITWEPRAPGEWAHWWLMQRYDSSAAFDDDGTWSDSGVWDDGGTWDTNLTIAQVESIRLVPKAWNAAHATGTIVLLNSGAELWNYPPGTWEDPGVWDGGDIVFLQGA